MPSLDRFGGCWKDVMGRMVSGGSIRLEMDGERVAFSAEVDLGGVEVMLIGGERCRVTVDDRIGS